MLQYSSFLSLWFNRHLRRLARHVAHGLRGRVDYRHVMRRLGVDDCGVHPENSVADVQRGHPVRGRNLDLQPGELGVFRQTKGRAADFDLGLVSRAAQEQADGERTDKGFHIFASGITSSFFKKPVSASCLLSPWFASPAINRPQPTAAASTICNVE